MTHSGTFSVEEILRIRIFFDRTDDSFGTQWRELYIFNLTENQWIMKNKTILNNFIYFESQINLTSKVGLWTHAKSGKMSVIFECVRRAQKK